MTFVAAASYSLIQSERTMNTHVSWVACLACMLSLASVVRGQDAKVPEPSDDPAPALAERPAVSRPVVGKPEAPVGAKPGEDAEEPAPARRPPAPPLDPRFIRLHMLDGSVIAGNLSITDLPVDTDYGKLSIPIASIRSFVPGLKSHPQLAAEIDKQIEELGTEDFKAREQAHRDLAQRGMAIKRILEQRVEDASAEQRRHLQQLLKELEEQDSADDENPESRQPWIEDDTIVTQRFTIVGRITRPEFQVESKYGPLSVKLLDVTRGERDIGGRDSLRKVVTVMGNQLAGRGFKSSSIRVEAGDRVTIRAQGSVVMTPWGGGQVSTPDGGQNYGWYVPNEIHGGALVVRIGDGGKVQKAGSRSSFVAKTSGVLQFAVAMAPEYSQEGYQFPGQYEVNVKIDPR